MMPSHSHRENPTLAYDRDLQLIEYAEFLGFDEFWVGEHHSGGWETIPAPDIFLAAAAASTKRIRLGTAVINLSYHHPFDVAERMAFLDHLTHGRIMMGCGPGILGPDIQLFGLDTAELRPMMNESIEIILKLYREDGLISYEGDYWQIKDMEVQVKPYQQPHFPIYLVSSGSGNSIRLASKHGLGMISGVGNIQSAMGPAQQWTDYQQLATEAGHRVSREDWRLSTTIYVAESTDAAMEEISKGVLDEAQQYFFHLGLKTSAEAYPGQPADEITIEQLIEKRGWIIGDPDYCAHRIRELEEATGGFGGLLMVAVEWSSTLNWHKSLELFARYVMPQFKGSLRGIQASYDRMVEDNRLGRLPNAFSRAASATQGESPRQ